MSSKSMGSASVSIIGGCSAKRSLGRPAYVSIFRLMPAAARQASGHLRGSVFDILALPIHFFRLTPTAGQPFFVVR